MSWCDCILIQRSLLSSSWIHLQPPSYVAICSCYAVKAVAVAHVVFLAWRSDGDVKNCSFHLPCRPACETVLLHFEQFKIPEKLARFAVKHGMSGFVKTLAVNIGDFVEERRKRVKPVSVLHVPVKT